MSKKKTLICLILVFSLVLSCATPTQAASISRYVNGFSVSRLESSAETVVSALRTLIISDPAAFLSLLYYLGLNDQCIIFCCNDDYLVGLYWGASGVLCSACFVNPLGSSYYRLLGVYSLSELNIVKSYYVRPYAFNGTRNIYFSEQHALSSGNSDWSVIRWEDGPTDDYEIKFRCEDGYEFESDLWSFDIVSNVFGPYSSSCVIWDTTDPDPDTVDPVKYPVWSIDIEGGFWNYLTLGSDAPTLQVEALSMDGGTISYQWCRQNCNDASSITIPGATSNTYTPPTDEVGSWMYWCFATNTCADGSHVSITSSTYCLTVTSNGGSATENISWTVNDSGILVISGKGAIPSYPAQDYSPWGTYKNDVKTIVIEEGITGIGDHNFYQFKNVTSISLPTSLLKIEPSAFLYCEKLSSISLPNGLLTIGNRAFAHTGLKSITIPDTVGFIGEYAFAYTKLSSVYMLSSKPPIIGANLFYSAGSELAIFVPYGSKTAYVADENWSEYADIIYEVDQPTFEDTMQDQMGDIQDSLGDVNQGIQDTNDKLDELPGQIGDSFQDVIDKEEEKNNSSGNSSLDDLTNAIPDYSQDFIVALDSFVDAFSYEGTSCKLVIPGVSLPGIKGLVPETEILPTSTIDFESVFLIFPYGIVLLVRSLLTIALIVYCFKELYDTISYFLTLKRGDG